MKAIKEKIELFGSVVINVYHECQPERRIISDVDEGINFVLYYSNPWYIVYIECPN